MIDGATPLYVAAQNGHTEIAQLLIDKGANVNQADNDGATPLCLQHKMVIQQQHNY